MYTYYYLVASENASWSTAATAASAFSPADPATVLEILTFPLARLPTSRRRHTDVSSSPSAVPGPLFAPSAGVLPCQVAPGLRALSARIANPTSRHFSRFLLYSFTAAGPFRPCLCPASQFEVTTLTASPQQPTPQPISRVPGRLTYSNPRRPDLCHLIASKQFRTIRLFPAPYPACRLRHGAWHTQRQPPERAPKPSC